MAIPAFAKRVGKALYLDHWIDLAASTLRLATLGPRLGVSVAIARRRSARSGMPLDIVIPVIDKDADTLPYVIDSARKQLRHPITGIYLVCPKESPRIAAIGAEKGCVLVDEATLLPIGKKDISYTVRGSNRSGWLYQQFLKWCGEKFTKEERYLILDSDTVLVSPHVFETGGKLVFDYCDTVHRPYFEAYGRLMGRPPRCPLSFTSHHTLVDKAAMAELKAELERRSGKTWYEAIIEASDRNEMSSHSDYDTYGHFFFDTRKDGMVIRYWHNKSLPRAMIARIEELERQYGGMYRTLSFHEYRK